LSAIAQFDLASLLERAGAQPPRYGRGKWHCPKHPGSPSLSVDESKGLFNCHHAGCDFRGSTVTLSCELGLARRLTTAEYREVRQERERADRSARALYERVKARRFELSGFLHTLNDMEATAHTFGPDNPAAWDALGAVYCERPAVLAELAILENCTAEDLIRFLSDRQDARERLIEGVLVRGELWNSQEKFAEVPP
jgi:hypothetical protein